MELLDTFTSFSVQAGDFRGCTRVEELRLCWLDLGSRYVVVSSVGAACTDQRQRHESQSRRSAGDRAGPAERDVSRTRQPATFLSRRVFAFGNVPRCATRRRSSTPVTSASATGQSLRIIMDELLRRQPRSKRSSAARQVDDDAFERGAATARRPTTSRGARSRRRAQAVVPAATTRSASASIAGGLRRRSPKGDPVGVLDVNNDGAADNTSFKAGAVGIQCGARSTCRSTST